MNKYVSLFSRVDDRYLYVTYIDGDDVTNEKINIKPLTDSCYRDMNAGIDKVANYGGYMVFKDMRTYHLICGNLDDSEVDNVIILSSITTYTGLSNPSDPDAQVEMIRNMFMM